MEYDYYKLYLGDFYNGYDEAIICESLEQVQYNLNKANEYTRYLVIGHIRALNQDDIVCSGTLEINQSKTRTRKKN